jgi:hypothetical protein
MDTQTLDTAKEQGQQQGKGTGWNKGMISG